MRISARDLPLSRRIETSREAQAVATDTGVTGRVCGPQCTVKCPTCGSTACQCKCSPDCPEAPALLSSDPKEHPVEPGIVPLVFALKRTGYFSPCWSCEGHLGPDGALWKLPRVWFYCDSMVHVRLLYGALHSLKLAGILRHDWQVAVTFSDPDNPETTFSLEPDLAEARSVPLKELQADSSRLADALEAALIKEARNLQRTTEAPVGDSK